jgi:hypothetical protein
MGGAPPVQAPYNQESDLYEPRPNAIEASQS